MDVKLQLLVSIVIVAMIINAYSAYGQANMTMTGGLSQLEGNGTQGGDNNSSLTNTTAPLPRGLSQLEVNNSSQYGSNATQPPNS